MESESESGGIPRVFHLLDGDAQEVRSSPTGSVGTLFSGSGIEMVWVAKQGEIIDPDWFVQRAVDLLVVLQGELRVEFERRETAPVVLTPGDLLVLPGNTRCRAYRWPRDREQATIFLAVYPQGDGVGDGHSAHSGGGESS